MTDHLINRFQYNYWANNLLLDTIREQTINNEQITRLLSHIFNCELMWFERMTRGKSDRDPWEVNTFHACSSMMWESQECYSTMLHKLKDEQVTETRTYYNSEGREFNDKLIDLIDHVLNHSNHHRAQIALLLRQNEYDPPATDYIFYLRKEDV